MCLAGGCSSTSAYLHESPAQMWQPVGAPHSRAVDRCEGAMIPLPSTQRHVSSAPAKTPS